MRNEQDMPLPSTVTNNMGYPTTVDTGQVQPWIIEGYSFIPQNSSGTLTPANSVWTFSFEVTANITVTAMRWRMGATATGNSDLGIYDSGGNLLGHTGSVANTASVDCTANLTANLTLAPGRYYMAITNGNTTDTYNRLVNETAGTPLIHRAGVAANTSTGGITPSLPSTLGAISATPNYVTCSAIVSGGIA